MTKSGLSLAADFPTASEAEWRVLVEKTLGGRDFDKAMTSHTYDGIALKALYTKENACIGPRPPAAAGPAGLIVPHWNPDAKVTNEAILEDLTGGATGVALRVQAGAFPGVSVEDLEQALDGIHLNMARLKLVPGEEYEAASDALLGLLERRNYAKKDVSGSLGIDPIGTLAQTGRLLETVDSACNKGEKLTLRVLEQGWDLGTFTADGGPYHIAGATEAQELGLVLSAGLHYLRALERGGLNLEAASAKIDFALTADADMYLTVAKFRAIRILWAQILRQSGCPENAVTVDAVSSLRMMSINDPWVNILRGTTACFAASMGGADNICILPHDTMLGMSSSHARRIARNIHIILQEESGIANVDDPSAGSYAFESITSELSAKAWKYFQKIESTGGIVAALKAGTVQKDMETSWAARRVNLSKRKDAITGVSEFPNLEEAAQKGMGAMPAPIAGLAAAGETVAPLAFHRLGEEFETLRAFSDTYVAKNGRRPSIFIANIGTAADFTARSSFAKNFFEAGGIKAVIGAGGDDLGEIGIEFKQSGAAIAIVCSTNQKYADTGADTARVLVKSGAKFVYLAGKPENKKALEAAGIGGFIHVGCDVLLILAEAYSILVKMDQDQPSSEGASA